ncbi:MAG: transglutaminase domain-containing protein [Deltaproteobacteria bacterium]|nr:transglutaminase domain-containing protein [Deltaproteobacteria bacterium]
MIFALLFLMGVAASPFTPESVHYRLQIVVDVPAQAKADQDFRLWIPYPPDTPSQKVHRADIKAPYPWQIKKEKKFGNRFVYLEGKGGTQPWSVLLRFDVERKVEYGGNRSWNEKEYLGPTPWIPFSAEIKKIGLKQTRGLQTPFQKIRALYDYIYETLSYDKTGEGWGRGDPIWACANKRGNCTDFHSLFIALARSQNIPARFEMGVPIPTNQTEGEIPGYHCWAQAFDPERGWIPLDASESKKLGRRDYYFNRLGQDRILLSVGRGLVLNPPQNGEPLNFFFAPYLEADGKKAAGIQTRYTFRRLSQSSKESMSASIGN